LKVLLLTLMVPQHTEKNKKVGQTWALEEPVKPDKDSHPVIIELIFDTILTNDKLSSKLQLLYCQWSNYQFCFLASLMIYHGDVVRDVEAELQEYCKMSKLNQ
jgi:hypothetical protein